MAKRNRKARKQGGGLKETRSRAKAATRAGSNAGRGFRYQDAVSAWLAVEMWAGLRPPAIMIPEGGDDVELRGCDRTFIQIKSRREHLGNYSQGATAGYIKDLWSRCLGSSPQPDRLQLVLERNVVGLDPAEGESVGRTISGPITASLMALNGSDNFFPKTTIAVSASPQESSISTISDRLDCSPLAAQMCFAELLVRVGALADANGRLVPEEYRGLSVSDTETAISGVLAAVDIASIESAIQEGICEPVDFLTPLYDPNFYLGVDVEPGHIVAGLVAERPKSRSALVQGIEERRAALIAGPSGAGKSALMWEAASAMRHTVRWFRIRRLGIGDIPALRQLIRTFRASEESPVGFVMDDVGRNGPEGWGALLKEAMSVPGVVMLGSVREEDVTLIAERARAVEVRAEPDDELAERLWQELQNAGKTDWAGWREPWKLSDGLLLEYVHILTRGRRMQELLSDQVTARVSDPARSLELDILRSCGWAGTANIEIDASRLASTLTVSEADLSRALQRLIQEHLVRSHAPGTLAGLHQLRSEELLRLTHQVPLPTFETSFKWTVASVSATDLESLVADALSKGRLPVSAVLDSSITRLECEPDAMSLASVLRGLGTGRIFAGVDDWLETPEVSALPRTQVGTAAMFGAAGTDLSSLDIIPGVQAAADRLSQIKGSPEDDPRRLLMERLTPSMLSVLIELADLVSLAEILAALVGVPLPAMVRSALCRTPSDLLNADLGLVGSVLGALTALDREIAVRWVTAVGQEELFAKIQAETAWAGTVSTETADDGIIVCCDHWYVAGSVQENPHDAVVKLCELLLALCPSADIAMSNAITASGGLAGLADYPLATKRIPRDNLPPPSIPQWNKRWSDLISRHIAAPSYSDYLVRSIAILESLVPTLEKVFDAHLRGKNARAALFDTLNSLNAETEALTPPAISSLDASGSGSEDASTAVTKLQNLLHCASVNLIRRFALLPEQAGAYIGWLNNLISDADVALFEEPWQLVVEGAPPALERLRTLLEALRLLAGEAHEKQEPPAKTWINRGKRAQSGNAVRFVSIAAKTAGEKRLVERKAEIERAASNAGIQASLHLRMNAKGVLPWPPFDVLALLPVNDVEEAVIALEQHAEELRSLVNTGVHMTIMPVVDGVAFPAFSRSGYQSLLPDVECAVIWSNHLGLENSQSGVAGHFGEVLNLVGELGSMERLGLGIECRPEEEIVGRRTLEAAFVEKKKLLAQRLASAEPQLQADVFELVDRLRVGDIDFAGEAQTAMSGGSTSIVEAVGHLTLLLIEQERQMKVDKVG